VKWLNNLLNFLFPSFCKLCEKPLSDKEILVCKECFHKLPILKSYCKKCGNPLKIEKTKADLNYCSYCEGKNFYFDKVFVLFEYASPVKDWIIHFKFNEDFVLAYKFGKLLGYFFKEVVEKADVIIPVPIFEKKHKQRGYNQTFILGSGMNKLKLKNNVLIKYKETLPQSSLSFKERWKNVKGVFKVRAEEEIKNRRILLVDDVITTGATLNECARVLKEAGAKRIEVIAIAKTSSGS